MINRRNFLKTIGIGVASVGAISILGLPVAAVEAPKKFNPDEFTDRILKGDRTILEEAKGIPPRMMNRVGELLYVKIAIKQYPYSEESKTNFLDFLTLRCVPWDMCDSVTRRIAHRRQHVNLQKWMLGHAKVRARILAGMDEKDPRQIDYHLPGGNKHRWSSRMPKRGVPFNEPEYWDETSGKAI